MLFPLFQILPDVCGRYCIFLFYIIRFLYINVQHKDAVPLADGRISSVVQALEAGEQT
jgi:hypothetical protein